MSLISEALRRAQQLKIGKDKTGVQNGIPGEILLGSEIVVGRAAKKRFLSQNRLIILGFLSLFLVISVLYNSSLFRRSSVSKEGVPRQETPPAISPKKEEAPPVISGKKEEAPPVISGKKEEVVSEKITTLAPSYEDTGSKQETIVSQKPAPRVRRLKAAPAWQAKKKLPLVAHPSAASTSNYPSLRLYGYTIDDTQDAKGESGRVIEPAGRASAHTGNQTIPAPTGPRQEERSHRIASEPLSVESEDKMSAKNHNNLGVTLYLKGDLKQALEQFKAAIRLNPNNIESYVNMGIVYKKQNRLEDALKVYKKAISIKPTCPELYYNLAILYDDLGNFKDAARAYYRFLQLSPEKYHPQKQKVQERLDLIQSYIK